jgi:MarR family transcriptional regulator, lower aerobic nicotinate degradation pathway regulator
VPDRNPPPAVNRDERDLGIEDALAQLTFVVQGILGRIAAYDASIVQARLLGILRDRRPTIKELAGLLQLDKSSVTGLVDRAQERGLVRRLASTVDRRSVQVAITPRGRRLIDQASAAFGAQIAELVADLSPTQRNRLSEIASSVVISDAQRRGMDILAVVPATG